VLTLADKAKVVALISGGIDSPVAAYLIGQHADSQIIPIFFDSYPLQDATARDITIRCCKKLAEYLNFRELYILPHTHILEGILKNCWRKMTCILCRRMMLKVAERFAHQHGAEALVTGESLGQVASQTLHNIYAVEDAIKIPILRPLIGLDKEEVVSIAKKIGTYEISTLPSKGCKGAPKHPSTEAKLDRVMGEEKCLDLERLVDQALNGQRVVSL
jgi:thiamine biosynthesis protein ThiI